MNPIDGPCWKQGGGVIEEQCVFIILAICIGAVLVVEMPLLVQHLTELFAVKVKVELVFGGSWAEGRVVVGQTFVV
jgi:hypothetical protein